MLPYLIAPNGKRSNLTPKQWKLVRTPAFKKWFGDWENSPETASKVVDENGEPLVVWHGSKSNENFNVFKQSSRLKFIYFAKTKYYSWFHFTQDIEDKPFQLKPFFLNIRNLLNAEEFGFENINYSDLKSFFYGIHDLDKDIQILPYKKSYLRFWQVLRYSNDLFDSLKQQDYYNGISFYENMYESTTWNDTDDYSLSYVVMNPNQIKLADGTNTTFDSSNPDIRYADGGGVADNIFDYLIKEKGFAPLGKGFWGKSNCTIKIDFSNVLYQQNGDNRVWVSPIEYSDYKKAFTILEFHCKDKNKGIGTALLKEIIQGADLFGYTIFIEPTSMKKYRVETDINTNDLKQWYSKYDFKPINDNYSDNVWLRNPKNPDIRFERGGDVNNKIVIRKIRQKDIPEITRNLAQVFDKSGWTANQLWNTIGYIDPNLSVVAEYNNQLAGFYFFNPNDIPRMYGIVSRFDGKKGVEGVALGVFKKFKDKGIGKKLIEYSQNNLDFDYIWGYQMKVLDNINDWLKRREIYQEYSDMYITYQMLK